MEKSKEEKRKKRLILLLLFILFVIIAIPGTYAWFTHSSRRTNKFVSGEIKHEIIENFNSKGAALDILPGELINKDVWIHNASKSAALLRVKITPVWIDVSGNQTVANSNDITLIFSPDIATNWTKGSDEYYYYNYVLEPHNTTGAHPTEGNVNSSNILNCYSKQLLDAVQLNTTVTDQSKYSNKIFDVVVESETLQVNLDAAKEEWKIDTDTNILSIITTLVKGYNSKR